MEVNPQKVIIVGATSGIGRQLAVWYAQKGCIVGATGRRKELLRTLAQQHPDRIYTAAFDVTAGSNRDELQNLIQRIGGLDLLIISAGGGDVSEDLRWANDERTVQTNVNGFVDIANYAFNFFAQQNSGHLVTISSVAAYRGNAGAPAYSASKAFQSIYFEGLYLKAKRLRKTIFVTCIEPGFVATNMAKSDKLFWVTPVEKAARQIATAIDRKKRKAFVSRRWRLIAFLLTHLPFWMYKRIV